MKLTHFAALMFVAAFAVSGAARADDEHHQGPAASAPGAQTPSPMPGAGQASPGGMMGPGTMGSGTMMGPGMMGPGGAPGMMGNMGREDMGGMMRMMQMMGMMSPPSVSGGAQMGDMRTQAMTEHVEGRMAFLRVELKITNAQMGEWNKFADAMRANAKKLAAVRSQAPQPGAPQPTLVERMAQEQRGLAARSEGAQGIKLALEPLYGTLSDEQKTLADQLLPPHLGLMPMGRM